MSFELFHARFGELAERETRSITISGANSWDLPAGSYGFLDMYCDEPGCDCRRAMLFVTCSVRPPSKQPAAVIGFGWEAADFYRRWFGSRMTTSEDVAEMMGPSLNRGSPQSDLVPALLRLFQQVVLPSEGYLEGLRRHYAMFRSSVDRGGGSPRTGKKRTRKLRGLR
jgi:hypothetical protein